MTGIRHISKFMFTAAALGVLAACGGTADEEPETTSVAPEPARNMQRPTGVVPQAERAAAPVVEDTSDLNMPEALLGVPLPIFMAGTEPFWSGSFEGGWMTLDRPGLPLIEVPIPELATTEGETLQIVAENLDITLTSGGCETSEAPLSVVVLFEEAEYLGCAGSAELEVHREGNVPDWSSLVPTSLAAIDSCLAAADGPRFVRALYPREEGTVGMILVDDVGRYEECGAEIETGTLGFFDPVSADQAEIWFDGEAMFARSGNGAVCNLLLNSPLEAELGQFHPALCR